MGIRLAATAVIVTVPTVLILDSSGSMATDDAPGPRIDAPPCDTATTIKQTQRTIN